MDAATEVEMQRGLNELRREFLDDRAEVVDWWLTITATLLTLISVVAVLGGYLSLKKFDDIKAEISKHAEEAKAEISKHAEEAKNLVGEIEGHRDVAIERLRDWTAERVSDNPDEAARTTKSVQGDPAASMIDRAIAAAFQLQQQGKFEEAVQKWDSIINIAGEENPKFQSRAWLSIGYLHSRGEGANLAAAIDDYTKAIELNPTYAMAYNNRGYAMARFGQPEAGLVDLDRSIELDGSSAEAYESRGYAMEKLRRIDEARADYQQSFALAQAAGNANLVSRVKHNLSHLDSNAEPRPQRQ